MGNKTDWGVLAAIILIMGGIGGYMIKNVYAGKDEFTVGGSAVTKRHKRSKSKSHKNIKIKTNYFF